MASSSSSSCVPTAAAAAAAAAAARLNHTRVYFPVSAMPKKLLLLPTKGSSLSLSRSLLVRSQLNEVVGSSSNDGAPTKSKPEVPAAEEKDAHPPLSEEAISEFMIQVASLVKLVDSRDIVELQLKHSGCELIIRKKDALPTLQQPPPTIMMSPSAPPAALPSPFQPQPAAVAPQLPPSPAPPPASAPKLTKSSHPPIKSPMSGTFYRSPGPGLPPFVKPGDKVNKGQVLCIIEAMKLMNEIEADRSGTVIEVLAEDSKPYALQPLYLLIPPPPPPYALQPLFAIEP